MRDATDLWGGDRQRDPGMRLLERGESLYVTLHSITKKICGEL
jgi:hypothetical protein